VVLGTLAIMGMTYVYMKNQILRLATDVRDLEVEHNTWKKRNYQLELGINRLTSQSVLQQRVNDLRLGFVKIAELNVVAMERESIGNRYVDRSPVPKNITAVSYNLSGQEDKQP
jgi:hypothetical protein